MMKWLLFCMSLLLLTITNSPIARSGETESPGSCAKSQNGGDEASSSSSCGCSATNRDAETSERYKKSQDEKHPELPSSEKFLESPYPRTNQMVQLEGKNTSLFKNVIIITRKAVCPMDVVHVVTVIGAVNNNY